MVLLATLLVSACGPSGNDGSSSVVNTGINTQEDTPVLLQNSDINFSTVTLQRGPVMFSRVEDAAGQAAMNYGYSNKYIFASAPRLPISAKGGYIDTNANGLIDANDTLLEVELRSYSNIISPITTIIDNNTSILQELMLTYTFTQKELLEKIPSETSVMMIILNNAFYTSLYKGYAYKSENFLQTIEDINQSYSNDNTLKSISDLKLLATALESKVLKELNASKVSTQNLVDINATLNKQKLQLVNNNFTRSVKTTDSIATIWNILIPIDIDQNVSNFSLGVHIEKVSTGAIGNIIISGASLQNKQMSDASEVKIFGIKSNSSTGSISYDNTKPITQGAIKLFTNKLLINLGYLIAEQTIISQSSFSAASTYNISIYSDALDINATQLYTDEKLQTSYSKYFPFNAGSSLLEGKITIE